MSLIKDISDDELSNTFHEDNRDDKKESSSKCNDVENIIEKNRGLITDIFGESDDEQEEENTDGKIELESHSIAEELPKLSDFDIMMQRKRQAKTHKRKYNDIDLMTEYSEKAQALVKKMFKAAENDVRKHMSGQVGFEKLKLLDEICFELKKDNVFEILIENKLLVAIKEWLTPLPDGSLPHIRIRMSLIQALLMLPCPSSSDLKSSGLGKAIAFLCKSPKELQKNRLICSKLINGWARTLFCSGNDLQRLTREEREVLDRKRCIIGRDRDEEKESEEASSKLKSGQKRFEMRASIPKLSNKDYIVRPESRYIPEKVTKESEMMKKLGKIFKRKAT